MAIAGVWVTTGAAIVQALDDTLYSVSGNQDLIRRNLPSGCPHRQSHRGYRAKRHHGHHHSFRYLDMYSFEDGLANKSLQGDSQQIKCPGHAFGWPSVLPKFNLNRLPWSVTRSGFPYDVSRFVSCGRDLRTATESVVVRDVPSPLLPRRQESLQRGLPWQILWRRKLLRRAWRI